MTPGSQSVIHDRIAKTVADKLKAVFHDEKPLIVGGYAPQTQPAVTWVYDHIDDQIDANAGAAVSAVLDAFILMTPHEQEALLKFHRISHGILKPGGDAGLDWTGSNPPTKEN